MYSRNTLMVQLLKTVVSSSATSTVGGAAVDLADYFPVGKREVKFVLATLLSSTSTGFTANMTVQECDSTATASFTNVLAYDGSTLTKTMPSTDATHEVLELHGMVTKRYLRILYNTGQATTGITVTLNAMAFPHVRAM